MVVDARLPCRLSRIEGIDKSGRILARPLSRLDCSPMTRSFSGIICLCPCATRAVTAATNKSKANSNDMKASDANTPRGRLCRLLDGGSLISSVILYPCGFLNQLA